MESGILFMATIELKNIFQTAHRHRGHFRKLYVSRKNIDVVLISMTSSAQEGAAVHNMDRS